MTRSTTSSTASAALPLALELTPAPTVLSAWRKFRRLRGCLLLESVRQLNSASGTPLGRYSFLMADPVHQIVQSPAANNPLAEIQQHLSSIQLTRRPELPPFQGGIAGLLSYELNRSFESIRPNRFDEFQLPALAMGVYDVVIAWDHLQDRAWIISTGVDPANLCLRADLAQSRLDFFSALLTAATTSMDSQVAYSANSPIQLAGDQFSVPGPAGLLSNFSADDYLSAIQRAIDYIYRGDVFQINLAQRLMSLANRSSAELYERLRACNPAPFAAYYELPGLETDSAQIISASPERFVSVEDRLVETRPIKGTRRRTGIPMVDIFARDQLSASVKDRAENTMIVDLMRNDLSRCCEDDSIEVTQLCQLEEYQSVLHLVSAVQGRLRPECDLVDLIAAVFPGGSITGAPKIRAMEIIAELEPHARGPYCGSLGYLGYNGCADFNILIRTIIAAGGWWQIPVGGGIVSQSKPEQEYAETWLKAASMLRAIAP